MYYSVLLHASQTLTEHLKYTRLDTRAHPNKETCSKGIFRCSQGKHYPSMHVMIINCKFLNASDQDQ